jgi:hypothetical protein
VKSTRNGDSINDLRLIIQDAFPVWENYLNSIDAQTTTPAMNFSVKLFYNGSDCKGRITTLKNLEQRLGKYSITAPFRRLN